MVIPHRGVSPDYPCEWPHCSSAAVAEVNAQWTVVDFIGYYTCPVHFLDIWDELRNRKVDGRKPVDMWTEVFGRPDVDEY